MERNKFLVFCFAFVPGAGQMYLGMMKKGLVFMGAFWAVIAIAVMLNLGVLFVFLPIIWFYAFFDTFNSARYHADQRLQMDYKFWGDLKRGDWTPKGGDKISSKAPKFLGLGCILLGIYSGLDLFYPRPHSKPDRGLCGYRPWRISAEPGKNAERNRRFCGIPGGTS